MALRASWERGCPGVNGACVVAQAGSQGTRGSGAHPSADVEADLQGNSSTPSALLSFPPEHLGNGQGWLAWDGVCAPQREHEKVCPSAPCSHSRHF